MVRAKWSDIPEPMLEDEPKPDVPRRGAVIMRPKRRDEDNVSSVEDLQYVNTLLLESAARREIQWDAHPKLRYRKVVFRRWKADDGKALEAILEEKEPHQGLTVLAKAMAMLPRPNESKAQKFLVMALQAWEEARSFDYAVVHHGTIKGAMQLKPSTYRPGVAEIAFKIAPWAAGQNLTTSAVALMTLKAFDMGFQRIYIPQRFDNLPAEYVAKKLGFEFLGVPTTSLEPKESKDPTYMWRLDSSYAATEHLYKVLAEAREKDLEENGEDDDDPDDDDDDGGGNDDENGTDGSDKDGNDEDGDDGDDGDDNQDGGGGGGIFSDKESDDDPNSGESGHSTGNDSGAGDQAPFLRRRVIVKNCSHRLNLPDVKLFRTNSPAPSPRMSVPSLTRTTKTVRFAL